MEQAQPSPGPSGFTFLQFLILLAFNLLLWGPIIAGSVVLGVRLGVPWAMRSLQSRQGAKATNIQRVDDDRYQKAQ